MFLFAYNIPYPGAQSSGMPIAGAVFLVTIYALSLRLSGNKKTAAWITGVGLGLLLVIPLWILFAIESY
jgi:hypothetical protein